MVSGLFLVFNLLFTTCPRDEKKHAAQVADTEAKRLRARGWTDLVSTEQKASWDLSANELDESLQSPRGATFQHGFFSGGCAR